MMPSQSVRALKGPLQMMLLASLLAAVVSCSESSNPSAGELRDPASLEPLTLDPGAPSLVSDSASFYARYDQDRRVEIFFADSLGQPSGRLLRFEVDKKVLARRPDGTRFGGQDSILIVVRVNPGTLEFDFQPSGLQFNTKDPAELEVNYGHAGASGGAEEAALAIWVQEGPGQPYLRLNSSVNILAREVEAEVAGFSKYAVAY